MNKLIRVEMTVDENGTIKCRKVYFDGKLHGFGNPAVEKFNKQGKLIGAEYWEEGAPISAEVVPM